MTTNEGRCEPPPELRGVDEWHWVYFYPAGADVRGNPVIVRWGARAQGWWSEDVAMRGHSPAEVERDGWRYHSPVTPPAVVAALVEALEGCLERLVMQDEATNLEEQVRAALTLYREGGR